MACRSRESFPTGFCTAPASIALEISVTDSVSGRALADSTVGAVQSGGQIDLLHLRSSIPALLFGGARLGTYDISLSRPGYTAWTRFSVSVSRTGPCGNVVPVQLTARLQLRP